MARLMILNFKYFVAIIIIIIIIIIIAIIICPFISNRGTQKYFRYLK